MGSTPESAMKWCLVEIRSSKIFSYLPSLTDSGKHALYNVLFTIEPEWWRMPNKGRRTRKSRRALQFSKGKRTHPTTRTLIQSSSVSCLYLLYFSSCFTRHHIMSAALSYNAIFKTSTRSLWPTLSINRIHNINKIYQIKGAKSLIIRSNLRQTTAVGEQRALRINLRFKMTGWKVWGWGKSAHNKIFDFIISINLDEDLSWRWARH